MSLDQEMSFLNKFEWLMLLMMFTIPTVASNSQRCLLDVGMLSKIGLFSSLVQNGVVPAGAVCTFEGLFFLYAICAFIGYYSLRRAVQKRSLLAQEKRNVQNPEIKKAFNFVVKVFSFIGALLLIIMFVPDTFQLGHPDIFFERKKASLLMCVLCAESMIFGLVLALRRKADDFGGEIQISGDQP